MSALGCVLGAVSLFVGAVKWQGTSTRTTDVERLARRVDANAAETTAALCALRRDLESRVSSSRAFLHDHPHGIPGISAKTIREGIRNQNRTIDALSDISCPTP